MGWGEKKRVFGQKWGKSTKSDLIPSQTGELDVIFFIYLSFAVVLRYVRANSEHYWQSYDQPKMTYHSDLCDNFQLGKLPQGPALV